MNDKDLITTVGSNDIILLNKDFKFTIKVEEILKNWYQNQNYSLVFYLKRIENIKEAKEPMNETSADMVQRHPLVMLPDKRIELTEKKNRMNNN